MHSRKIFIKLISILAGIVGAAFLICIAGLAGQVFLFDTFPVNSHSMFPTIQPGDRIFVNKLIFGPRIYKNLNFDRNKPLESFRLKGFRQIAHNDLVVFNHPSDADWRETQFVINSVYLKRCIGLPGDTISIRDGIYRNSSLKDSVGLYHIQQKKQHQLFHTIDPDYYIFTERDPWSVREFGPLYIPRQGDLILMTPDNVILYGRLIAYESGAAISSANDTVWLKGQPLSHYRFTRNYYFMAGDNITDSRDSRYFGLVPEEFIVGVASHIVFSYDKSARHIRFCRIWRSL